MVVVDILTKIFEMHLVGIEVYIVYGDEGGLYLRWKLWGIDVPLRKYCGPALDLVPESHLHGPLISLFRNSSLTPKCLSKRSTSLSFDLSLTK
jgi:hypothetical protein